MTEIWKPIAGFEDYLVSNLGSVYSTKTNRKMALHTMKSGYVHVNFSDGKRKKGFFVHRLVADAFIPNPDLLPEVNHKDENKGNNTVENLEWCDRTYNVNYGTAKRRTSETLSSRRYGNKILCLENGIVYTSFKQAARALNVEASEISRMVSQKRTTNTVKGYHFKLIERWDGITPGR